MKHFYLTLLFCLTIAMPIQANPISREEARQKAEQFLKDKQGQKPLKAVTNLRRLAPRKTVNTAPDPYYVFDRGDNEGFVIVSGDDQTISVLGYTESGDFDYNQMPPAMQEWLDNYASQLARIQAGAPVITDAISTHPKVEPFMSCKWSQGSPYNNLCPLDGGSRSVTGCVATAMAQILYYNREKSVTETTADIPGFTTYTKQISVPGIAAGAPIDWDNMKDTYGSATELQRQAVAQLMLYCGVAVEMDYTNSSSGAQIYKVAEACQKYFGYGNSVKYLNSFSSEAELDQLVYTELAAGRPVYLGGYTGNWSVGHAFLTCGYENMRYYINWGWGGTSDGYYYLTNLTPGNGQGIGGSDDGYSTGRSIIIGFEPENYGEKAMSFSDSNVKKICVTNWDADGDGKLTYNEAAAVTSIGEAFKGNTTIRKFPELYYFTGITNLSDDAFNGCSNLSTLRLPKKLTTIGARALKGCKKLEQVNLPTGINAIGEEAFEGCVLLTEMELSNEITAIEKATFKNCSALTEFNLPISVTSIGDEAFAGCSGLTSFSVNTYHPADITLGTAVFGTLNLSKATLHVMQGTKSYFETANQWNAFGKIVQTRDISGGQFTTLEAGKTYYLYNVGTGRYLTKGEAYKTQAVVGTEPMRFKAVHPSGKPEGTYYFSSPDTGNSGTYLFRTSTDDNVGKGVKACFVDGTALTNAYWSVKEDGNNIYTIQVPSTESTYVEGEYLGIQTNHASQAATPTYGAYYDVEYSTHKLNCQWQFVLYDEALTERFNEAKKLERLISTAKKLNVKYEEEQVVSDNMESTLEEIVAAQSSLRKKLKFMEFTNKNIRTKSIASFDGDTDGELSYKEASDVTDFGWTYYFQNDKTIVTFDELQYFTHAVSIPGNFLQGCTNLESVIVPEGVEKIYYYAFKGCKNLKAINIPEYVNLIGDEAFEGCTALREVSVASSDPAYIRLGNNIFSNVPLAQCTLYVPFGSKDLYAQADVWKNFGTIVEVRAKHSQPAFSPITTDKPGYIYNIGTRKVLTMGEAYGTQSIVAQKGKLYQWKHTTTMGENIYYLMDNSSDKAVFRTTTDKEVGAGVKACFGDGSVSAKAYWKAALVGDNIYTLQVPENDADYTAGEYLGIDENHESNAGQGSTHGIYWDIAGIKPNSQWAFVTEEDFKAAQAFDDVVDKLKKSLATAKAKEINVTDEQAIYDNPQSTSDELKGALASVRSKLHFITFQDSHVQTICLNNWDADEDGEIEESEAAGITDISQAFRKSNAIKTFEELRYFTSLTAIPDSAFIDCANMTTITIPKNVQTMGKYAFLRCDNLKYVIMDNDQQMVPRQESYVPTNATLFVPADRLADYKEDDDWSTLYHLSVYTGQPVVSAIASREYGRTAATIKPIVDGAPVEGEPTATCDKIKEIRAVVGEYPITVTIGTVSTPNVQIKDGVFTILPAPITATAKSYTREKGQPNPTFEITFDKFRNRETSEVFIQQPVATCEADENSPAGEYEIIVSGGEAQNYTFTYVSGTLTITDATGIESIADNQQSTANGQYYDLQGRRVANSQKPTAKGLYIRGNKKVVVR